MAGLQRQMTFTSLRLGLYDWEKQPHTKGSQHKSLDRAGGGGGVSCWAAPPRAPKLRRIGV